MGIIARRPVGPLTSKAHRIRRELPNIYRVGQRFSCWEAYTLLKDRVEGCTYADVGGVLSDLSEQGYVGHAGRVWWLKTLTLP